MNPFNIISTWRHEHPNIRMFDKSWLVSSRFHNNTCICMYLCVHECVLIRTSCMHNGSVMLREKYAGLEKQDFENSLMLWFTQYVCHNIYTEHQSHLAGMFANPSFQKKATPYFEHGCEQIHEKRKRWHQVSYINDPCIADITSYSHDEYNLAGTGVIGSDVPWLECPACNALS